MDFINEEDVTFLDIREDASEVSGFFNLRARGGVQVSAGGIRDDISQGGFTEAGRAREENVLEHIIAHLGSLNHEHESLGDFFLAVEFFKSRRS